MGEGGRMSGVSREDSHNTMKVTLGSSHIVDFLCRISAS